MASQLNIKDPVLIERARDLARWDGQPVTTKLRSMIDKEWEARQAERSERLARMLAWAKAVQAEVPEELRGLTSKEIMDAIYDDDEPDGFAK